MLIKSRYKFLSFKCLFFPLALGVNLLFSLSGCAVFTGGDAQSISEQEARKHLRRNRATTEIMYSLNYNCITEQYKRGISRDSSTAFYPAQNVLYQGDSLISWIRLCDKNQTPYWETFPPQNPYAKIKPLFSIKDEIACIQTFDSIPLTIRTEPTKYYYFVYYLKMGGMIAGPALNSFLRKSLNGVKKHKCEGKEIEIIFVNSNP